MIDSQGILVTFPAGESDFALFQSLTTSSEAHPPPI